MPRQFIVDNSNSVEKKFKKMTRFYDVSYGSDPSAWKAITLSNQIISADVDDLYSSEQSIGFNFNFAGENFSSYYASPNGFISFKPLILPVAYTQNNFYRYNNINIIAPFWGDLRTNTTLSGVYYENQSDCLVVLWRNLKFGVFSSTPDVTFQMHLYKNGDIKFVYGSMSVGNTVDNDGISIGISSENLADSFISIQNLTNFDTSTTISADNLTQGMPAGLITELDSNSSTDYKYIFFKRKNEMQLPFSLRTPGIISIKKNIPYEVKL